MKLYKHYKGGHYELITHAELESDHTKMVVYRSLDDERIWVRPLTEFESKFTEIEQK